jgi:hypothetical protein
MASSGNLAASLPDLFAGHVSSLPAVATPVPLTHADPELDNWQREAVSQALAAPDLFLIQGLPGTGKSRVVAEIITQAVRRGQRVLLLSPGQGALERALHFLEPRAEVLSVRPQVGSRGGSSASAEVRAQTLEARSRALAEEAVKRADARLAASAQDVEEGRRRLELATRLRNLAAEWDALEADRRDSQARRQQIVEEIAREATSGLHSDLASQLETESTRHRHAFAALQLLQAEGQSEFNVKQAEHRRWADRVKFQQGLIAARSQGRFFSLRYWRALVQGRPHERLEEFQQREAEASQASSQAEAAVLDLNQRCDLEIQRHQTAVEQIRQAEIGRRQAQVDAQLRQVQERMIAIETAWEVRRRELGADAGVPARPDASAADAFQCTADKALQQLQREAAFAAEWQQAVRSLARELPDRFCEAVNLVAATTTDIVHDPHFGDRAPNPPRFNLLIVEQAERLSEAELVGHLKRGERCILVGHPPLLETLRMESGAPAGNGPSARPLSVFHRLWQTLHCDPRRLPYQWFEEDGKLICRLVPPGTEQQSRVEVERLVDHPDVELRIVSRPHAAPALAEVSFPLPQFTVEMAKAYLYLQLGELTLRPSAAALRWRSENGALWLETASAPETFRAAHRVQLEEGVSELVDKGPAPVNGRMPCTWATIRLEFDTERGWSRERAESWLRERAGLRSLGRTALLENQHRASAPVARFWGDLLDERLATDGTGPRPLDLIQDLQPVVQCVAVPYHRERPRPRTRGPQRPAPPPAKSFEIDLADPKQRQRLPIDLQLKVPQKGLVNFAEAQAILHWLDLLSRAPGHLQSRDSALPSIAVLSWQATQVQFLQILWKGTGGPRSPVQVRFETVAACRDLEADIALISLCRSNAQRVVGFADYPEEWRWVLTVARHGILIFGDPEAVRRRGAWTGAVTRQTEASAALERAIVQRLHPHFVSEPRRQPAPQGIRT